MWGENHGLVGPGGVNMDNRLLELLRQFYHAADALRACVCILLVPAVLLVFRAR